MKIYTVSDTDGTCFFKTLKEARKSARESAAQGREATLAVNYITRLNTERAIAMLSGCGWAENPRDLETWGPDGEPLEDQTIAFSGATYRVKRIS